MSGIRLGVVSTSNKENEHRAPIHPDHIPGMAPELRERLVLEEGYGTRFGTPDSALAPLVGGMLPRAELFAACEGIILPKPTPADFPLFREGQLLWGWPHCVQGPEITQVAIDKRMTLIAWEAMHLWRGEQWDLHVFHLNNELAGYCSVLHALQLKGITGHYGRPLRACVISFGSTGRGAIHALQGMGIGDITLFTQRPGHTVGAPVPSVKHWQYRVAKEAGKAEVLLTDEAMSMAKALGHFDIVVNCILQNTDAPLMYLGPDEGHRLRKGTLIIDVSCDLGMGFSFARPTSFEEPAFSVCDGRALYYAVDHTPSYLWDSATQEISTALLPFLPGVLGGPEAWAADPTLKRAIEIQDGVILNPKILSFQNRSPEHPHPVL